LLRVHRRKFCYDAEQTKHVLERQRFESHMEDR
jgi:hypothetical protein